MTLSPATRVHVHITADLLHANPEARCGRVLVHGGLTDEGTAADGCVRCGAVIRVWLSHGRWLLWCDHTRTGWQARRDDTEERAA